MNKEIYFICFKKLIFRRKLDFDWPEVSAMEGTEVVDDGFGIDDTEVDLIWPKVEGAVDLIWPTSLTDDTEVDLIWPKVDGAVDLIWLTLLIVDTEVDLIWPKFEGAVGLFWPTLLIVDLIWPTFGIVGPVDVVGGFDVWLSWRFARAFLLFSSIRSFCSSVKTILTKGGKRLA